MNPNSLGCLQIQARRRQEFSLDFGLVFVGPGKSFKIRETCKGNNGTVIMGQQCGRLRLGIILTREGATLSFLLHNLRNAQTVKQLCIPIENNYVNYHHIFRVCNDDATFLFYHESKTEIEIRSFNTLKKRRTLDLLPICQKFNLLESLNQIKVSLEFDSIDHLGKIVLVLVNKLVLVKKDSSNNSEILFDCADLNIKERLMGVKYDSEQKVLIASGMVTFFLFGFDDIGLSYSRQIACNQLGRAIRLLGWDPKEEIILIAQRIMGNKENYHLIDYRAPDPVTMSFLKGQSVMGTLYDPEGHKLHFIDVGADKRKEIRTVNFKEFRENYDLGGQQRNYEIEVDTERYTSLPPISETYTYYLMKTFKGLLFFKPLRAIDEKALKDFPLRM